MAAANRIEGIAGGGRGPGSYSYRGSELTAAERRALTKQNKSAESLKNKDLDKMDKNKARYKAQKEATAKRILQEKKTAAGKAGVAGVALGAVAQMAVDKAKAQKKSTTKINPKAKPKVGMIAPKPRVGPLQQPKKKLNPLPKPKKLTKSEQDFIDGQKLKKKITKKTGIYPNTAN
jgi:hypothetical protein